MTDFLNEKQKEEFLLKIKNSGKSQKEVAEIIGVSQTHLSSALPFFGRKPRKTQPKQIVVKKVPAKWEERFDKEMELQGLRKAIKAFDNLRSGVDKK